MAITAKKVSELLTRQGVSATIRVYADESFDPDTNTTINGEPVDYSLKAIPPYRTTIDSRFKATELISYGRGYTGIANYNLSFTVKPGILITANGKVWLVVGVEKIANNTGTILFVLEIESQAGYDNLFTRSIAGTTAGVVTLIAILRGAKVLFAGSTSGSSSIANTDLISTSIFSSTTDSISAISGSIAKEIALQSIVLATSQVAGGALLDILLYAVSNGVSGCVGALNSMRTISGTSAALSTVLVSLTNITQLFGDTAAVSSVEATTIVRERAIIGTSASSSTTTGVLTVTPSQVLQDSYNTGDDSYATATTATWYAMTFTANSAYDISSIRLKLFRGASAPANVIASIRATTAGIPSGADLTSGTIAGTGITQDTGGDWYEIELTPESLLSGTKYAIVVRVDSNSVAWRVDNSFPTYADGNGCSSVDSGVNWATRTYDFMFETYSS